MTDHKQKRSSLACYQLIAGPHMAGHRIWHNDEACEFIIDEKLIRCTAQEYQLLMELLCAQSYVTLTSLVQLVFQSPLTQDTRKLLTKCVSRVRNKLWRVDLGISCLVAHGYMLIPEASPVACRQSRRASKEDEQEAWQDVSEAPGPFGNCPRAAPDRQGTVPELSLGGTQ